MKKAVRTLEHCFFNWLVYYLVIMTIGQIDTCASETMAAAVPWDFADKWQIFLVPGGSA